VVIVNVGECLHLAGELEFGIGARCRDRAGSIGGRDRHAETVAVEVTNHRRRGAPRHYGKWHPTTCAIVQIALETGRSVIVSGLWQQPDELALHV